MNVDFADVRTIMASAGTSLMGQGRCSGVGRAREAALTAISSPLLDIGIERATGIVWNITGPPDLTLFEVRSPFDHIKPYAVSLANANNYLQHFTFQEDCSHCRHLDSRYTQHP